MVLDEVHSLCQNTMGHLFDAVRPQDEVTAQNFGPTVTIAAIFQEISDALGPWDSHLRQGRNLLLSDLQDDHWHGEPAIIHLADPGSGLSHMSLKPCAEEVIDVLSQDLVALWLEHWVKAVRFSHDLVVKQRLDDRLLDHPVDRLGVLVYGEIADDLAFNIVVVRWRFTPGGHLGGLLLGCFGLSDLLDQLLEISKATEEFRQFPLEFLRTMTTMVESSPAIEWQCYLS